MPPPDARRAALQHLPWLLETAPLRAVQVATGVPGLQPADVLQLTRGRFPLPQLLLLQHAVMHQGVMVRVSASGALGLRASSCAAVNKGFRKQTLGCIG